MEYWISTFKVQWLQSNKILEDWRSPPPLHTQFKLSSTKVRQLRLAAITNTRLGFDLDLVSRYGPNLDLKLKSENQLCSPMKLHWLYTFPTAAYFAIFKHSKSPMPILYFRLEGKSKQSNCNVVIMVSFLFRITVIG